MLVFAAVQNVARHDALICIKVTIMYNWKIHYTHVPTTGRYNTIPTHEDVKQASIETQLTLGMFKEANEVIARIKDMK
jgi:hypothetical protein